MYAKTYFWQKNLRNNLRKNLKKIFFMYINLRTRHNKSKKSAGDKRARSGWRPLVFLSADFFFVNIFVLLQISGII